MSDAVKWALLVAAVALIFGMIFALPIFAEFDGTVGMFAEAVVDFVALIASYIHQVKGLVLILVPTPLRSTIGVMITFMIASFVLLLPINITKMLYAWIFK